MDEIPRCPHCGQELDVMHEKGKAPVFGPCRNPACRGQEPEPPRRDDQNKNNSYT